MKSTLDLPPTASHLKHLESDSMNWLSHPHCRRSASNCSTQKTVHRAEMSPNSTSADEQEGVSVDGVGARGDRRTAELERSLTRGSKEVLDGLGEFRIGRGCCCSLAAVVDTLRFVARQRLADPREFCRLEGLEVLLRALRSKVSQEQVKEKRKRRT